MFCWVSQQSLISFSSTFVSSAAERIDLAIATNSPEATTKIKYPPRRLGKIPKNSYMSEGQ